MKLLVELIRCHDCVRSITDALLTLDLGARIRFPETHQVRVEGRLTLADAARAIEARGFRVAKVLDATLLDTGIDARGRAKPWAPAPPGSFPRIAEDGSDSFLRTAGDAVTT